MRRLPHRLLRAAATAVLVLAVAGSTRAAGADPSPATGASEGGDPAAQLAERFAPYVAIQQQDEQCGKGEAFQPDDVSIILDQPDVVLRDSSGRLITTAPSAADLFNAPAGSNFDLPGSSLRPGCDYDRRFGWRTSGQRSMVYARVVTDPTDPDRLVLQYWLYFVYNDWNNRHETDWEMMQLVFDAPTAEAALTQEPAIMSLSQHYGNERRAWDRVERVGDRPVVYPAEGAHAIFYTQNLWFGMSGDAGFGCDDSRGPSTRLDPVVTMLPDAGEVTADGGFGWLGFKGHWGERQRSVNDSELGPQTFRSWNEPLEWMAGGRDGAVRVPDLDLGVTSFFCSATVHVSHFFNSLLDRPWVLLGLFVALVAVVAFLVTRTRWRPTTPRPVMARRRSGQMITASFRLVTRNPRRFLPVAVLATVGGIVGAMLQPAILKNTFLGDLVGPGDRQGFSGLVMALAAGAIETIPVMVVALVVGMAIVRDLDDPRTGATIRRALRGRGVLPMVVVFAVLLFAGPLGWWLLPAFAASPGIGTVEGPRLRDALRSSMRLTRGRRLRILVLMSACFGGALLTAPLIGIVVLLLTAKAFWVMNIVVGLVNAVTLPWLAATLSLLYADLRVRADQAQGADPDPDTEPEAKASRS